MCPNCDKKIDLKKGSVLLVLIFIGVFSIDSFATGSHGKHSKMNKTNRETLSDSDKKEVIAILEENEALHNSYFNYNGKKVEKAAMKLKLKVDSLSNPKISKLLKFSSTKLDAIKAKETRDNNNKNYNLVSMALIHIVNTYEVGDKYNAYSCPMVKKNWIQNSKKMAKVHNPYDKSMEHCGSKKSNH